MRRAWEMRFVARCLEHDEKGDGGSASETLDVIAHNDTNEDVRAAARIALQQMAESA